MPIRRAFCLPLILLLLLIGCRNDAAVAGPKDVGVASWKALQQQIINAIPEVLPQGKMTADFTFKVEAMRRIRDEGSLDLWLKMCKLTKYPLVEVGGYQCIASRAPDHQLEAALLVMAHRNKGATLNLFYRPFFFLAKDVKPTPKNLAAFTKFIATTDVSDHQYDFAFGILDHRFLSVWAVREDVASAPPNLESFAVAAAIDHAKEQHQAPPPKIKALMASFAHTHDARLVTWLTHTKDSQAPQAVRNAIAFILRDDDLDNGSYVIALHRHRDFIRNKMDLEALALTPKQRKRIMRLLHPPKESEDESAAEDVPQGP